MAKGRCKKVTIAIGKAMLAAVTPIGFRFIANTVKILQGTDFSNDERRRVAVDLAKAEARLAGREAKESAIRAAVEIAVSGLKVASDKLDALGELDPQDMEGVEMVEV